MIAPQEAHAFRQGPGGHTEDAIADDVRSHLDHFCGSAHASLQGRTGGGQRA